MNTKVTLYIEKDTIKTDKGKQMMLIPNTCDFNLKQLAVVIIAQLIVGESIMDKVFSYKVMNFFIHYSCIFSLCTAYYLTLKFQSQKIKFIALWPYLSIMSVIMTIFIIWLNLFKHFDFTKSYTEQMTCLLVSDVFFFLWIQADKTITSMI